MITAPTPKANKHAAAKDQSVIAKTGDLFLLKKFYLTVKGDLAVNARAANPWGLEGWRPAGFN
jgi:hypothetical protein